MFRYSRADVALLLATILLPACSGLTGFDGPREGQMRAAYQNSAEMTLMFPLLSEIVTLDSFKKIDCNQTAEAVFACRFSAQFALKGSTADTALLDKLIRGESGKVRQAVFLRGSRGVWEYRALGGG